MRCTSSLERALDGAAYASLVGRKAPEGPITAEGEAEKPTRKPPARKAEVAEAAEAPEVEAPEAEEPVVEEPLAEEEPEAVASAEGQTPKKRTRRGSRGRPGREEKPAGE